ncbi:LysM peptidoglycan-binding domain-containing protein [Exilibacterium tricleocarpae]|uniref:LysM peptidoglycan-binding domain-containing protein n=1 Tax=Exilibacterium tricleocarpae TaxID=2591008 RepID=A0A545TAI6_9GAMM|nr:LysM peptidoglycan-binding domain-containing protein [Exilibacterium tricleocarpae]TQV74217.1 LysM peptidoglycan-binding domain-containing protein [Exilibacterium tricleocarpae]
MNHIVKKGENLTRIAAQHNLSLTRLLAANPSLKADPNSLGIGAKLVIPEDDAGDDSNESADYFRVAAGQLTFDAEGLETPGRFFSRRPHVPSASSGVTIGRGYDMKERSAEEIVEDLTVAGVAPGQAQKFAQCRGLQGARAEQCLRENNYTRLTITPRQQQRLFDITYAELMGDVVRISGKPDVVAKYGETDWQQLHPLLRDVVVDLRYRGDYTGATRERVQPVMVQNNLTELNELMADRDYWVETRGVPLDRFRRRRDYLASALT